MLEYDTTRNALKPTPIAFAIGKRIWNVLVLLFFTSFCVFYLVRLSPGGPTAAAERQPGITAEQLVKLRNRYGLDRPLHLQYLAWIGQVIQGDLGFSTRNHRPVRILIQERLVSTLSLMGVAISVTIVAALAIAIISAMQPFSVIDSVLSGTTIVLQSVPAFLLGNLLIWVFYVNLTNPLTGGPLFPSSGMYSFNGQGNILDRAWHFVLPVATLCLTWTAWYSRYLRTELLHVKAQDFIFTARAKGLSEATIVVRHALPHSLLTLITVVAVDLPVLFGGALFVEVVFAWPGMGRLFWDAATARDYPVVLAILLVNAALVIAFNMLADVAYRFADPRLRNPVQAR